MSRIYICLFKRINELFNEDLTNILLMIFENPIFYEIVEQYFTMLSRYAWAYSAIINCEYDFLVNRTVRLLRH